MSKRLLVLDLRTFLIPSDVVIPAGAASARTPDGALVSVDADALRRYEVSADEALTWQQARLAEALQTFGQLGDVLGKLSSGIPASKVGFSLGADERLRAEDELATIEATLRAHGVEVGPRDEGRPTPVGPARSSEP